MAIRKMGFEDSLKSATTLFGSKNRGGKTVALLLVTVFSPLMWLIGIATIYQVKKKFMVMMSANKSLFDDLGRKSIKVE